MSDVSVDVSPVGADLTINGIKTAQVGHNRSRTCRTQRSSNGPVSTDLERAGPVRARALSVAEENLLLRRHLRKQEDKIKLLATKLVRLLSERRHKEKRDEILIEEQKTRISGLEDQLSALRDKLTVSRQQLTSMTSLTSYTKLIPHCPGGSAHKSTTSGPNSATAIASTQPSSLTGKKSVQMRPSSSSTHRCAGGGRPGRGGSAITNLDHEFTSRVEQLLLEAKAENQALEDQLRVTRSRLSSAEREVQQERQKAKEMEVSYQEEVLKVKGQLEGEHDRHKKKKTLSDNIQLIRLQRESRRTSSWLSTLETQCRSLESSLSSANETISGLESQVASLQDDLREGQQKALVLQKELEDSGGQLSRLKELEAALKGLQEENLILKQTNDSLVEKSLSKSNLTSVPSHPSRPRNESGDLRTQLDHLQTALKSELNTKTELLLHLETEQKNLHRAEGTVKDLESEIASLRAQHQLKGPSESEVGGGGGDSQVSHVSQLAVKQAEWESELSQTQWQLVQLRDELDKTRALLRTQMTINKEAGREIDALTQKLDKAENFQSDKLTQFMSLLEERTRQMSILERTLDTYSSNGTNVGQKVPQTIQSAQDVAESVESVENNDGNKI